MFAIVKFTAKPRGRAASESNVSVFNNLNLLFD